MPRRTIWALLAGWALLSAQGPDRLTVGRPEKLVGKRNASVQVKIPLTVQTGFHVNSNQPLEEYLIPLKLTWTSTGALQAGAVDYPKASIEKFEFAEMPLSIYSGSFDVVAHFKVAPNASAGPGAVTGKLRYQACNDRACFAPKTIDVTVVYQVE
ncbi:MAG TPA: protein-disulfide reductase DsbD domain-containing protein [Bryobacteraceae bacterium]|nr:protein-disulfide reductase DsbD domain-containing protein [Bryobacteraceae bacterium]